MISTLGSKVSEFQGFETFPCPPGVTEVKFTSSEVTAVCPVTGQPDFYTIQVRYVPNVLCVESKTVKLYFQQFRGHGEFAEAFACRIAKDFCLALEPESVTVILDQIPRGGWGIQVVAEKYNWEFSPEDREKWSKGFLHADSQESLLRFLNQGDIN